MTREQGILQRCGQELFEDQTMVRNFLKIFAEGGFWLLQHAHAECADDQLRGSNERGGSMLTAQVFTTVASAKLDRVPRPTDLLFRFVNLCFIHPLTFGENR